MLFAVSGCKPGAVGDDDDDDVAVNSSIHARIEVDTVSPRIGSISERRNLNATTEFLLNDIVRSPIAGYIGKVYVTAGESVQQGDLLFSIQGKEASAIAADSILPSKGTIKVKATEAGIVKEIYRQQGDYMQDGDQFCILADNSTLIFILDVPFEIHRYIEPGRIYPITLPDGEIVKGIITRQTPQMDKTVQMERYLLKPLSSLNLPEGLIASVNITTNIHSNTSILPKTSVLSNENQTQFWVMKVLNDSTAVRTDITKGLETKDSIEIIKPAFTKKDRILVSGNYGVPDTIKIKILKK